MNHVGNILGYRLARELKLVSNESYQRELAVCIERPTKYWSLPLPMLTKVLGLMGDLQPRF